MRIRVWGKLASRIAACAAVMGASLIQAEEPATPKKSETPEEPGIIQLSDQAPPVGYIEGYNTGPQGRRGGSIIVGQQGVTFTKTKRGGYYTHNTNPNPSWQARGPLQVWLANDGSRSYPPGSGWAPPVKYPIHRDPIVYQRFLPSQYYGSPNAQWVYRPEVYTPTDTTQLGYTYQHVPTWQPRALIPARPIPHQWHYQSARQSGRYGYGAQYNQTAGAYGAPGQGGYSTGQPTPVQPTPDPSIAPGEKPKATGPLPMTPAPEPSDKEA